MATSTVEDIDRHITKRFEISQKLGKGAYGVVWRAMDKKDRLPGSSKEPRVVALKKIFDAFQNSTDAQRTFREVTLLQQMKGHPNIISLLNVLKADNDRDLYLVFEYMDTDLNAAIKANILEDVHKAYIMYQCFDALRHMHARSLVHRDLKPANLLLNAACLMKVCDFGLARSVSPAANGGQDEGGYGGRDALMTDYVATRWYRAPEILVGSNAYAYAVDMWSAGCILAECLLGKPFFTGTTTMNQIERIMGILGTPVTAEIDAWHCPFAKTMIDSCMPPSRAPSPILATLPTLVPPTKPEETAPAPSGPKNTGPQKLPAPTTPMTVAPAVATATPAATREPTHALMSDRKDEDAVKDVNDLKVVTGDGGDGSSAAATNGAPPVDPSWGASSTGDDAGSTPIPAAPAAAPPATVAVAEAHASSSNVAASPPPKAPATTDASANGPSSIAAEVPRLSIPERMALEDRTHGAILIQRIQRGKSSKRVVQQRREGRLESMKLIDGLVAEGETLAEGVGGEDDAAKVERVAAEAAASDVEAEALVAKEEEEGRAAMARRAAKDASLREALPNASSEAIELLCALLCFKPNERATAEDAMRTAYCSQGAWVASPPGSPESRREGSSEAPPVAVTLKFNDSVKRHTSDYREAINDLADKMAAEEAEARAAAAAKDGPSRPAPSASSSGIAPG